MEYVKDVISLIGELKDWSNNNQGLLSLCFFVITIVGGFVSGIFSSLRRKPNFRIQILQGPSFYSVYCTGEKDGIYGIHRVCFALYLKICNVGSAASSIEGVSIGYHWDVVPFSACWFMYRLGWFWIREKTVSLKDFQVRIGDNVKVFPFLFQCNQLTGNNTNTYLEVGNSVVGVVYYEQSDSWGGCYPKCKSGYSIIKVAVSDVFGHKHCRKFSIPLASLEEARKYNPSFGLTLDTLHGVVPTKEMH